MEAKINNIVDFEITVKAKSEYCVGDLVLINDRIESFFIAKITSIFYFNSGAIYSLDIGDRQMHCAYKSDILGKLEPVNENYRLSFEDGQIYVDLDNCPINEIKPKKTDETVKSCNCSCDCDTVLDTRESFQRLSKDEYYINIAKAVSKRSTCLRRQYGAVIINNDEIVSTGYNGSPRGEINCCDIGTCKRLDEPHNSGNYSDCHSVHAEQNAIISASRKEMIGATLYLYGEEDGKIIEDCAPCPICSRIIKNSGIIRVVGIKGEIKL